MLHYGAAYYPEQETSEDIQKDVALMREAGFNAVRVGEFAWCRFEPHDGQFGFAWFDAVLEQLGAAGIKAIVCTPTACPPIWMVEKHPDILYRDNRGVVRPFGGRRHYCYSNRTYRDYCRRIADELGRRYGSHPHVLGFHIDNELAQEATGRCQCAVCRKDFQQWLAAKYETIDAFNRRAGTIFWGQTYERFSQIEPPLRTIEPGGVQPIDYFMDNPTLRLDWERFCSEALIAFQNIQADALHAHTKLPVTTNATGMWTNGLNYHEGFKALDLVAADVYPSVRTDDMVDATLEYAYHRGLKRRPFWLVETSSGGGQGVWAREGVLQPYPGALRQNALQAFVCDAEVLTYFQFRTFRFGAEQLEASVLMIDGRPDRRFREMQEVASELPRLNELLAGTHVANDVAICFDYDTLWAHKIKPIHRHYTYQGQIQQIHRALAQAGIGADIVSCSDALKGYKMVIVPTPVVMADAFKQTLRAYVAGGGTLVTNFLAAIKGSDNTAPRADVPAGLTDLFGLRVVEGEPVHADTRQPTTARIGIALDAYQAEAPNHTWTESLELHGAEAIARYADTFRAGEIVAARQRHGRGTACYLGTLFDVPTLANILAQLAQGAGVARAPVAFAPGTEVIRRRGTRDVYWLFNYRPAATDVSITRPQKDLWAGKRAEGCVSLPAKGWMVLSEPD